MRLTYFNKYLLPEHFLASKKNFLIGEFSTLNMIAVSFDAYFISFSENVLVEDTMWGA